jgi:putative tricarboxylic transport membrane protein
VVGVVPDDTHHPLPTGHTLKTFYRRVDLGIAIALSVLGLVSVIAAAVTISLPASIIQSDPVGPRGFAYLFGTLTTILGLALLRSLIHRQRAEGGVGAPIVEDPEATGDDPRFPASSMRAFIIMALTLLYAFLLNPLGYMLSTMLYVAGCMWAMDARRRTQLVVFPVAYALSTYLLFDVVLHVRLPERFLEDGLSAVGLG